MEDVILNRQNNVTFKNIDQIKSRKTKCFKCSTMVPNDSLCPNCGKSYRTIDLLKRTLEDIEEKRLKNLKKDNLKHISEPKQEEKKSSMSFANIVIIIIIIMTIIIGISIAVTPNVMIPVIMIVILLTYFIVHINNKT